MHRLRTYYDYRALLGTDCPIALNLLHILLHGVVFMTDTGSTRIVYIFTRLTTSADSENARNIRGREKSRTDADIRGPGSSLSSSVYKSSSGN